MNNRPPLYCACDGAEDTHEVPPDTGCPHLRRLIAEEEELEQAIRQAAKELYS